MKNFREMRHNAVAEVRMYNNLYKSILYRTNELDPKERKTF